MLKKMMMLASMSLAALAFAAPGAQAADFLHEGEAVTEHDTFSVRGKLSFGNPAPGQSKFGCDIHATITVTENGEAHVTHFEVTTTTCAGEGLFAGCVLENDSNTATTANGGSGWAIDATTTREVEGQVVPATLIITGAKVVHNYKAGSCAGGQLESVIELPELKLTPNNDEAIGSFNGGIYGFATNGWAFFSSGLIVDEAHQGTYGIA